MLFDCVQERAGLREAESKHTTAVDNRRREKQEEIKQEKQQLLVQQQVTLYYTLQTKYDVLCPNCT